MRIAERPAVSDDEHGPYHVRHLMGDGQRDFAYGVDAGVFLGGQQGCLPEEQQAPILHGACLKVRDCHQIHLGQRVGHIKELLVCWKYNLDHIQGSGQIINPAPHLPQLIAGHFDNPLSRATMRPMI